MTFFHVKIFDDGPAANPKLIEFDYSADTVEDARGRGWALVDVLYSSRNAISVYARPVEATGSDRNCDLRSALRRVASEARRPVSFRAIHVPRVTQAMPGLDFIKLPTKGGWFAKAECRMTAEERGQLVAMGIPFSSN